VNTLENSVGYIERTDRKSHSTDLLTPMRSTRSTATHTHTSTAPLGSPLGGLLTLSETEGCWMHVQGRVAKPLVGPLTPVPCSIYQVEKLSLEQCMTDVQDQIFRAAKEMGK